MSCKDKYISDLESEIQYLKKLLDAIVTEDKETGKASLNIPVKDKESVMQFVSLLGKLLNP